jgi:hypothetical protein
MAPHSKAIHIPQVVEHDKPSLSTLSPQPSLNPLRPSGLLCADGVQRS